MEIESMTPAAGSVPPSQKMSSRTGYWMGGNPDKVIWADDYEKGMAEIANSDMSPDEKKAAMSDLKQRLWNQRQPYKH